MTSRPAEYVVTFCHNWYRLSLRSKTIAIFQASFKLSLKLNSALILWRSHKIKIAKWHIYTLKALYIIKVCLLNCVHCTILYKSFCVFKTQIIHLHVVHIDASWSNSFSFNYCLQFHNLKPENIPRDSGLCSWMNNAALYYKGKLRRRDRSLEVETRSWSGYVLCPC